MKQILILLTMLSSIGLHAQRLMTYNVKNDYQKTGDNNWNSRKDAMVELLKHYEPAVLGVQEALLNQLQHIDSALQDYRFVGVGRDDAKQKGEYCAIFYNTQQFELLQHATFYLSETPDIVSKGWDAAYPRICTYALFKNKHTQLKMWVFNTHFDHVGTQAREESAKLILHKIRELNKEELPLVLMGDFNLTPEQKPIVLLQKAFSDAFLVTKKPFYGPEGTFNGFSNKLSGRRIDYVFVEKLNVKSCVHIDDRMGNNKYISDHFPVLIEVE